METFNKAAPPVTALRLVVLVSGYGSNLKALIRAQHAGFIKSKITAVVCNNPEAFALSRAIKAAIPTLVVPSSGVRKDDFQANLEAKVAELAPDLIVLAGFMQMLSKSFIARFKDRIINIHPSLLPAFPGINAQQQAINAGVKVTGCTVHFVDEGCDTGPIILQKPIEVEDSDTAETLGKRLLVKEHQALVEVVKLLEEHKVILQGSKTLVRSDA